MPQNNELYHWKYIKREWKNGRWKYYYDDREIKVLGTIADKAGANVTTRYENATAELRKLDYDPNKAMVYDGSTGKYKTSWKLIEEVTKRTRHPDKLQFAVAGGDRSAEYKEHYANAMKLADAGREYVNAYVDYNNHPISKIHKFTSSGKAWVKKLVNDR